MSDTSHLPPPELSALLRERAPEIEAARRLPDDVVAAVRDAGLFRSWVPSAHGGPERTAMEGLESIAAVAADDGGAGWSVMIALTTSMTAYLLPTTHAEVIYGDPDAITGGFAAPAGTAVALPDGGLRVNGRWAWGSGTSHCTAIAGGVRLVDADGRPAPRADGLAFPFVFFDREDVTLLGTWHVMGLSGSGSTDYTVTDAIVPEGRWVEFGRSDPVVERPLSRFPMFGLLALGVASVSVGLARRGLEELVDLAGGKRPQGSRRTLAERQTTQVDVARAEATVRSAWAFVADVVGDAWETAEHGDPLTVEQRRLLRLAATDATARCSDETQRLHKLAGGVDAYLSSPIQRVFRDAHVASQHAMVAERTYELAGRLALGLDTDASQL